MRGWPVDDFDWAHEDDDFTFQKCCEFQHQNIRDVEQFAFRKLLEAGRCARRQDCNYMWVDYCCVGPEDLAESIGSRYQWYAKAEICLVYLPDGQMGLNNTEALHVDQNGCPCKWWMQTWTVQVILASRKLVFYNRQWEKINTFRKCHSTGQHLLTPFEQSIQTITQIPPEALLGLVPPRTYSVAARLSWATGPFCEREEDLAYSLVGIFGINMEPNYGEGWQSAFHRLAAEIMRSTSDLSILAWHDKIPYPLSSSVGALPNEPDWNLCYDNIVSVPSRYPVRMTAKGVSVTALLYPETVPPGERYFMCLKDNGKLGDSVGIYLRRLDHDTFQREERELTQLDIKKMPKPYLSTFCIAF